MHTLNAGRDGGRGVLQRLGHPFPFQAPGPQARSFDLGRQPPGKNTDASLPPVQTIVSPVLPQAIS
jgi:hypothetical protein